MYYYKFFTNLLVKSFSKDFSNFVSKAFSNSFSETLSKTLMNFNKYALLCAYGLVVRWSAFKNYENV